MVTSQAEWLERRRPEHEREKPGTKWGQRGEKHKPSPRQLRLGHVHGGSGVWFSKCSDKLQQDVWFESNFSSRMCDFSTEVLGILRGEKKEYIQI